MSRLTRVLTPFLFVTFLLFLSHCQKKDDAPATAQTAPSPGCCVVAPATGLSEGMGRIVVNYPGEAASRQTRIDLYKAGDPTSLDGAYGNHAVEMAPGLYDVVISGKRVAGVTVQAGHDTQVKVGVLHLYANPQTRIDLLDPAGGKPLIDGYGEQSYGLPVGPVSVQVAGQSETVTINDGQITEF
jgi:hypothetical protein